MTIPLWMLLGFATWTATLLMVTIGLYRWREIFAGRARIASFKSDDVTGADWYRRSMRAHANCIENLPVFGVIVFVADASGFAGTTFDRVSIAILASRVVQSLVHVSFEQTDRVVAVRFSFFCVQLVGFLALAAMIARHAWG